MDQGAHFLDCVVVGGGRWYLQLRGVFFLRGFSGDVATRVVLLIMRGYENSELGEARLDRAPVKQWFFTGRRD